jgi:hypothetical protein
MTMKTSAAARERALLRPNKNYYSRGFEILFNRGNGNLLTSIMALVTSPPVSSKIEHRENDC